MTQEQYADLQRYIPESDMVKMVFETMHPEFDFSDWNQAVTDLADKALSGDKEALLNLLELTHMNSFNEGMLEGSA